MTGTDTTMDTALLAIDLQRDFLEETGRLPVSRESRELLIANANRLLRHAGDAGWKVILIRNEFRRRDWIGNLFRNCAAIEGSRGAEIDSRIAVPAGALMLSKARASGFANPTLDETLKGSGISRVIVFGIMTEECVHATAVDAIRHGYSVVVVSDAVASEYEADRISGLDKIRRLGADLRETSEILEAGMKPVTSPAQTA